MLLWAQFLNQPGFRQLPVARNRHSRDSEHFGRFLDTQATKESKLHHLTLSWVEGCQSVNASSTANKSRLG